MVSELSQGRVEREEIQDKILGLELIEFGWNDYGKGGMPVSQLINTHGKSPGACMRSNSFHETDSR
jgi:hypothetical protein